MFFCLESMVESSRGAWARISLTDIDNVPVCVCVCDVFLWWRERREEREVKIETEREERNRGEERGGVVRCGEDESSVLRLRLIAPIEHE